MNTHIATSMPMPIDDDAKIRAAVLDYMEGWYTADAERVERALHPDLAKRAYLPGPDGKPQLSHLSALALVQFTRKSNDQNRHAEVKILDRFEGAASVRATMTEWVDFMHLVKVGAEWKIINILWELTPERWIARGGAAGERTR
jgi:Putative lumazine-binding